MSLDAEEYFSQDRFKFQTRYEKFVFPRKVSLKYLKNFPKERGDLESSLENIGAHFWKLQVGNKFAEYKLDRRYKGDENYIIRKNCPFMVL